ncbi:hypothetical protein BS47DRAFT_195731 [Hydnum rufescens UP504]|uniref:Uncharacterized protein n=1 Tax=Hydnum rufescens UP504 TaxID=1448309 RepID=A0A9P6DYS4_9AGAM|nr:hypothetical protein BS47DRAFT_195731 [Hydnum rufescens UP504]
MSSILHRLSNTPSASVDRDPTRGQSSIPIGSSSILRKLSSTVSSSSLSLSSRRSSSLWTSVTSKAHILFKSHTSNRSRNSFTKNPRIKAGTKLCTIREDPANDNDNDKDKDPGEGLSDADRSPDPNHPNVKDRTASETNNTLHTVLAVDYQAPLGPFYMPRAIGIVVQPKTKNQPLLSSRAEGPVTLRAPRKSRLAGPLSSQKKRKTSPNTSSAIARLNTAPSTLHLKSRTTIQKHATAFGTAHQRKDRVVTVSKQSSMPSKAPSPKGETKAITSPRYSRPTNPALSKKGDIRSLSLNTKTGMVRAPTHSRRLAAPTHSTSIPFSKSNPKISQDLSRSKPLPALPRVALQHRISIKSPSFIPVNIPSSSDESEETDLSTPTRVGGKWRGSLTYPATTKASRLPTAGGSPRGGRTHPQQRPSHQKNIVKPSLPLRTALSSVKNTYQVPAPVQTSISPIPNSIPTVGNKGLVQGAPSKRGANVKNIQRGPVIASSTKARSPREVCTINAFAACPSPSDEFVHDKHRSQSFLGARPTSSFIPAVSSAAADSQVLSRCGSLIRTKKRRSKDRVESSSLQGMRDHRVTLSIVSPESPNISSNLGVSVGTAMEDSILAERPLSGLFSFQTEVSMLSLMHDFPDSSSQFLQDNQACRQSNPRSHPLYSPSLVGNSWTKRGRTHTIHFSTDEDRCPSSYSLPVPEDRSTVEEMNEAKAYLENFPEWVIEEDTTFIMARFSSAYPSSHQFYPSPSDSSSLPSPLGMAQNEPTSSSSQDRISMVLSLTSDTDIILRGGANRPPSSIAWESDQLSARMKSLEEDVRTGLCSSKIPGFRHAEENDTVRISSCFGLSGVSDTNSLLDLSTSWGRFGSNLLDVNLP